MTDVALREAKRILDGTVCECADMNADHCDNGKGECTECDCQEFRAVAFTVLRGRPVKGFVFELHKAHFFQDRWYPTVAQTGTLYPTLEAALAAMPDVTWVKRERQNTWESPHMDLISRRKVER